MFKKIVLATVLTLSLNVFAHEGHDEAPGSLKANHGGTVKKGKDINLEYVVSGSEVKLFPLSHEGQDLPLAEVKLTATSKLPKGKAIPSKLEVKDSAYVTEIDFKEAYRVEMNVDASHKGKKSSFKFQVEK